ncbi:mutL homolog 3 L homeolog isoform X2 [Xenopus laevis]|uniref:DNA mismatch repair protein Mlh3 n=2 Tax=Xenopus laevis TaxID=8355 RepID=A0A974C842_XENLA|nr:mutL homolog 3 L homeolog isoform X2 [Xenopus laevis]XP_018084393.1 mutL homolog 3 L homeolog isoform X2 [Xenopus laevis]OCT68157.1 hypothetical protein XELAEV_18039453mg [Xenopus laevis]OCT68158.1 hypothetical protein XELAEV_18039453mg [Xenopus laevis]
MIRCLKEEVRYRLRSGVTINSVGQCVEELVLNSIDALSTCIAVRIDLETVRIQVVDNGCGLCQEDMDSLGMRYYTSKCHSLNDLENLKFHGFRGEAIASIANVSSIVEVSSKCKNASKTFYKLIQNGKLLSVQEADTSRPSAGTTFSVYNLFYNLPVRRKCMDQTVEFENIRQRVESLSLIHPSVSFSLKNDSMHSVVLQLAKTKDVRSRFCQIYGLPRSQKLCEIQHKVKEFDMWGYISCEAHYNKRMQYLYVNKRLVLKTKLHQLIDFLLRKESSICKPKNINVGKSSSPGRSRSCQELHGIFVINIYCHYSEYDVCFEPAKTLIEFKDWDTVLHCVEEGTRAFLKREKLYVEPLKEDALGSVDSNNFISSCSDFQLVKKQDIEVFKNAFCNVRHNYEDTILQSKPVCRHVTVNTQVLKVNDSIHDDTSETTCGSLLECNTDKIANPGGFSPINCSENEFCVAPTTKCQKDTSERCNVDIFSPAECSELPNNSCSAVIQKDASETMENENSVQEKQTDEQYSTEQCNTQPAATSYKIAIANTEETSNGKVFNMATKDTSHYNMDNNVPLIKNNYKDLTVTKSSNCFERLHDACPDPNPIMHSNKVESLFKLFSRPGPVSAQEIFKNNIHALNSSTSPNSEGSLPSYITTTEKTKPYLTISKNISYGHAEASTKSSSSAKKNGTRPLGLVAQTESLESFKQYYGKLQTSTSCLSVPATATSDTSVYVKQSDLNVPQNNSSKFPHYSEVVAENLTSTNNLMVQFSVNKLSSEESLIPKGQKTESHDPQQPKESPLTLPHYESLKQNRSSTQITFGSLAAKLSKLKQREKVDSFVDSTNPKDILDVLVHSDDKTTDVDSQRAIQISDPGKMQNSTVMKFPELCQTQVVNASISNLNECSSFKVPLADPSLSCSEDSGGFVSSDWFQCYEGSLGKYVFINTATGLSSYISPKVDGSTICTKDLTTTAVNIVCNNDNDTESGNLKSLFSKWENPVYARHPVVAVDVSRGQTNTLAVKIHNILYPYRFTKEMMHSVKVLQQVDNKFIACLMSTEMKAGSEQDGNLLVLVDQHAAHERVRLEQLIADSYESGPEDDAGRRQLKTSIISPPLELNVTEMQYRLLRVLARSSQNIGLSLSFPDTPGTLVLVSAVPVCFVEREANEIHRGRSTVAKNLVQEFLQEQVELLQMTGRASGTIPLTVLKVLASQACHGAVKFNDKLSLDDCKHLMQCLSRCSLPFQCAHGRPAILPLADMLHLESCDQFLAKPNLKNLKRQRSAWELTEGNHLTTPHSQDTQPTSPKKVATQQPNNSLTNETMKVVIEEVMASSNTEDS